MKRLTIDTNVYISAFEFGGLPLRLLDKVREGKFAVAISLPILDEITRVLSEKFHWPEERLTQLVWNLSSFTRLVEPQEELDVVIADSDDNRIVECALAAASEAIVTGDNDLLSLGTYRGIQILRVSDLIG